MKTGGNKWWAFLAAFAAFLLIASTSFGAGVLRTSLRVNNLSCTSCLSTIGSELQTLPGALGMDADIDRKLVIVDHQQALTAEEIAAAISRIGYQARVLSTVEVPADKIFRPVAGGQGYGGGGCCGGGNNRQTWAPLQGDVITSVYRVENLACASCLATIGGELQRLPGTIGLEADVLSQVVFVDHQAGIDGERIAGQITAAGYPAQLVGSGKKVQRASSPGGGFVGFGSGCGGSRSPCGATASAWQQLYQRYFAKKD
jgi:Cu+-exporting ATPase